MAVHAFEVTDGQVHVVRACVSMTRYQYKSSFVIIINSYNALSFVITYTDKMLSFVIRYTDKSSFVCIRYRPTDKSSSL